MRPVHLALMAAVTAAAFGGAPVPAQAAQPAPAPAVAAQTATVLDALRSALGLYIHQEKAPAAVAALNANRSRYLAVTDPKALAAALTADLGAALSDKHFYVRAPGEGGSAAAARDPNARAAAEARAAYGIEAVRRLPGNVGYMDLRMFGMTPESGVRMDAAMDLLAETHALIIDLRENRGGGGEAMGVLIARLSSQPIPRSVRVWREENGSLERETLETPDRPAEKRYGKPVYILTSGVTFSAAETFAYDLQASKRAVVVGAVSRGGANPMNRPLIELGHGYLAFIPNGRSENPITKTNANGTGVQPDLRSEAGEALELAYRTALAALPDDGPQGERTRALADPKLALAGR